MRGGYYPALDTQLTDAAGDVVERSDSGSFTLGAALGFWFDIFGVGIGIAPEGGGGTTPTDADALGGGNNIQMKGPDYRLDFEVPLKQVWFDGYIRPRVTYSTQSYTAAIIRRGEGQTDSEESEGRSRFFGFTLAAPGGAYSASIGPSHIRFKDGSGRVSILDDRASSVTMEGWGAELRVSLRFAFPAFLGNWRSSSVSSGPSRECTRHVTTECSYGMFGYRCTESSSCY